MVLWDWLATANLHATPGGLRRHRVPEAHSPLEIVAIEIASKDSNRLYRTVVHHCVGIILHHMGPQSREDRLSSKVGEIGSLAGRAVAVDYMQRWAALRFFMLELQVLGFSPRVFCYATAYIVVRL